MKLIYTVQYYTGLLLHARQWTGIMLYSVTDTQFARNRVKANYLKVLKLEVADNSFKRSFVCVSPQKAHRLILIQI